MEWSRRIDGTAALRFAVMVILIGCGCHHVAGAPSLYSPEEPLWAVGTGGIAVTEEAHASRVAADILRAGGNAVDAAVAAAFTLAVTYPEAGNIGGGGFLVAYDGAAFWAVDFRETAPAAAYRDMYLDLEAARKPDPSRFGPAAAGIPGTPAGLYAAWERGGSMPWADLVRPAIGLARDGFAVGARAAESFAEKSGDLRRFYSTRQVFLRRGATPDRGSWLTQRDLAASLELIARNGARGFYEGALAERLVEEVRKAGGIWTLEDLAAYHAVFRIPGRFGLGDVPVHAASGRTDHIEIITMPPPSSGSLVLGQAISFLEAQEAFNLSPDDTRRSVALVEALRLAFADRNTLLADPERMRVPMSLLLDPQYLQRRAALLPADPPGDSGQIPGGHKGGESVNTTHIVVMDASGGVVSLTTTVNALFGCKFLVPGTGILLNNEMDDFDTRPGIPNMYGLVGSGVNAVAPGARMLSSMSPTIVVKNGKPWLALGSRGGPRILSAVLQVIINRCVDRMDLMQAVGAPRIHHQWWPDTIFLEATDTREALRASLEAMGYATATRDVVGRVIAAERLDDGRFLGVRDARISGIAVPVVPDE